MLHVLSDARSKINDEFEKEVKKLNEKYEQKKKPILERRDQILRGELAQFEELLPKFDEYKGKLETFMAGIVKDDKEDSEEEEEKKRKEEKEPRDYTFLKE